jgi:hypothetical protein
MTPLELVVTIARMPVSVSRRFWFLRATIVDRNPLAIALVFAHRWRQQQLHQGPRWWRRWWKVH